LAREVADWIVEEALRHQRRFSVCLSGGSTPKRLYELLGAAPRRARFPWERTHWFWGDERFVPHNDPRRSGAPGDAVTSDRRHLLVADRAADPLGRPSPLGDEESEQTLARK
jgi:hypothetical protein